MGSAERRAEMMKILCRRRYETITNLAFELGVSKRTILRDIEVLSLTEPIYTQCGRYGGGIYVMDDYVLEKIYMSDKELSVLNKIADFADNGQACRLDDEEKKIVKKIISDHTKPTVRKGQIYEKDRKRVI